ncbi:MAG: cadmium resistance transporter [Fluviibacter sp.]|jgi:cadmium resistance protein CadD (predicted permease)
MAEIIGQLTLAIIVFVSTNIDDIFLLAAFFADKKLQVRSVVIGQVLGIAALVAVSCMVAWLSIALPEGWISLLGFIPLYLGLAQIKALWSVQVDSDDDAAIQFEEQQMERSLHSQVLAVAGVTVANGGDNLGVYIPLFATSFNAIPLFVGVFAVMTFVWCLLGYVLVNNQMFGKYIRKYGHKVLPIVLVLLGVEILSGALVLFR